MLALCRSNAASCSTEVSIVLPLEICRICVFSSLASVVSQRFSHLSVLVL